MCNSDIKVEKFVKNSVFRKEIYLLQCRACLDFNNIFVIQKTSLKWIIKVYWYTKCFICYLNNFSWFLFKQKM